MLPAATPVLDFTLVCLLKKLMGFERKSVWKLLNLLGFLSVSLIVYAAICMDFEENVGREQTG